MSLQRGLAPTMRAPMLWLFWTGLPAASLLAVRCSFRGSAALGSMVTNRCCNAWIVLKEMAGDAAQNSLEEQRACISLSTLELTLPGAVQYSLHQPCSKSRGEARNELLNLEGECRRALEMIGQPCPRTPKRQ